MSQDHGSHELLRERELDIEKQVEELLQDEGQSSFDESSLCHRFSKVYLELSALFCHVDLLALDRHSEAKSARITSFHFDQTSMYSSPSDSSVRPSQSIRSSEWRREAKRKIWPYLVTLTLVACILNIIYYLYHQYTYDIYSFKLSRQRWLKQTQTLGILEEHKKIVNEHLLIGQLEEQGRRLKSIGAPFMHMSFVVESVYIAIMFASFITYVSSSVFFTWSHPFNFYFIRNFFNIKQEQRRGEQFVRVQVQKFINSSINYSHNRKRNSDNPSDVEIVSTEAESSDVVELVSCKQLNKLLHSRQLRPLNQKANGVNKQSLYYALVVSMCSLNGACFDIILTWLMINYLDKPMSELRLADWMPHCELMILLVVCEISSVFHATNGVFTCLDQAFLVNKLRKLLKLIIQLNNLRFHRRRLVSAASRYQPNSRQTTYLYELEKLHDNKLMNRDILLIVMHYRIHLEQFLKLKHSLSIIASTMVFLMFIMPIVGRLHVPYFGPNSMRLLVVAICCMVILPLDMCLAPFCYLNKRSLDLYRELNYLLAHTIEISNSQEGRSTYDHHIISCLRKDLSHPDVVTSQLAIKSAVFMSITYENLLRLHFYAGFIILTIVGDNVARQRELTGTIFSDPLGLF